jgi:inosine/xanthosine triphosphate pyrophosphatase family protein
MKILFATTNLAKIKRYGSLLKEQGIEVVTPNDLGIHIDVVEDGKTPVENALIKANAFYKETNIPTFAMDDGLFLEKVPSDIQPGNNVRRVNGKRLSDSEMIDYYISLVNTYGENGTLNGYFLKGIAVVGETLEKTFEYKAPRTFKNTSSTVINEGYPLASIQYDNTYNKYVSELSSVEKEVLLEKENRKIISFIINSIKIKY